MLYYFVLNMKVIFHNLKSDYNKKQLSNKKVNVIEVSFFGFNFKMFAVLPRSLVPQKILLLNFPAFFIHDFSFRLTNTLRFVLLDNSMFGIVIKFYLKKTTKIFCSKSFSAYQKSFSFCFSQNREVILRSMQVIETLT